MNSLLTGLLGALLATNTPLATSNLIYQQTGLAIQVPDTSDPVEQEYQQLLVMDDEAQTEVDTWIRENQARQATGDAFPDLELNARILRRLELVRTNYLGFLERHTNHARAHLAYASFLHDIGREPESLPHLERARELDPTNPAAWNNLANYYGHHGSITNAFICYEKAIELNPNEPVYYQNFGTTVFLFRKDVMEHYGIDEQEVFDKALDLYSKAVKLSPDDFALATDVAQTFYGIRPLRTNEAFAAWNHAMSVAEDQMERDGVHLHLARLHRMTGNFEESRRHLNVVTNEVYDALKQRLWRALEESEAEARGEESPGRPEEGANVPDLN